MNTVVISNIVWPANDYEVPLPAAMAIPSDQRVDMYCFELFGVVPDSYKVV